jgi:hypothetical protein
MANLTITVPGDLKKQMEEFNEINWSAVARSAFAEKISKLLLLEKIASKSKLTEKQAVELGRKINKSIWEKHYKKSG